MYFIALRDLRISTNEMIEKNQRVPDSVPLHLCVRYEKLDLMKKVFDTEDEPDIAVLAEKAEVDVINGKSELELNNKESIDALIIKENKEGIGQKKLAKKYGVSQHYISKLIKGIQ